MDNTEAPIALQNANLDQNRNTNTNILNEEVWRLIWPLLPSSEKKTLRLVSSSIKNMVDTFLGVDIVLDNRGFVPELDEQPMRAEIPPACHLTLQDVVLPVSIDHFIKKPCLVKSVLMDGGISSATWTELLLHCQMIEKLKVSPGFATETISLLEGQNEMILPCLQELLFPNQFRKNRYEQNISWKIIENFLVCYHMPKLQRLMIRLFFKCQIDFASSVEVIEKFLQKHEKSLKHLELVLRKSSACCHPHEMDYPEEIRTPQSEATKGDFNNLKLKSFIANCDSPSHEVLDKILQDQNTLESLEYDKVWAGWDFYMPLIKQNEATLRTVKIRYAAPVIDLVAFSGCQNLQQLKMGTDHQMLKDEANLINFSSLPTSLAYLQIEKYTVGSKDLVSIENLINLYTLELEFLSNTDCDGTGITADVVKSIFRLPKLKVIYLEEFENPHTSLQSIDSDIRTVNMIKGDYITHRLGCRRYAVAVAPQEIFDKWESRVRKYCGSLRIVLC